MRRKRTLPERNEEQLRPIDYGRNGHSVQALGDHELESPAQ